MGVKNDITVAAWVKTPTSWANSYPIIIADASDANYINGFNLYIYRPSGQNLFAFIYKVSGWNTNELWSTFSALPDAWYHVVGVRKGFGEFFYINGFLNNIKTAESGEIVYATDPHRELK